MTAQIRMLLFLLTSIGLIVLPHVSHVPISIIAFFYVLLIWRYVAVWRPQYLPNQWLLLLLALLGIGLLYREHQGWFGRDGGTQLFLTALGLKLLEMRSERDCYLVNFLAFIVAASQFLYSQNLVMAGYILLVSCALLASLVLINSREPLPIDALKTAALIIVQASPIAVALFVLFPRVEAPRWLWFAQKPQARSGLSDSMEPGSISALGLSDELVFRVKFSGAMPASAQRYWRGPVLVKTDGKRWTRSASTDFSAQMAKPTFNGQPYRYTLLMEPNDKNWVFALDLPAEFNQPLSRNAYYQLITSDNPDKRAEYTVVSYPDYYTGSLTHTEYAEATQLPTEPSLKIRQFVEQLQGHSSSPDVLINHLLLHFRTEDFHYTLTPPALQQNPIETFLFETRQGFCEHYATAFTYLLRVAGVPARVVTGYQGGVFNEIGQFLEIRQADAHAWSEVWLPNQGWVRVDPTAAVAPERIEQSLNPDALEPGGLVRFPTSDAGALPMIQWLKQARQLWSHADYNWQRWVINYNSANQNKLLSSLGIDTLRTALYWLVGSVTVITVLLSWFILKQQRQGIDRALRCYQRFCQKLAPWGLVRAAAEGEHDFAKRAKTILPNQAEAIDNITMLFCQLRYGKTPPKVAEIKRLQTAVASFGRALKKSKRPSHHRNF